MICTICSPVTWEDVQPVDDGFGMLAKYSFICAVLDDWLYDDYDKERREESTITARVRTGEPIAFLLQIVLLGKHILENNESHASANDFRIVTESVGLDELFMGMTS